MQLRSLLLTLMLIALTACGPGDSGEPPAIGAVALELDSAPLFVGSYRLIPLHIDATSGISIDDLAFLVPFGARGGEVSVSQEFGAERSILLLAGPRPGRYDLVCRHLPSSTELLRIPFVVTRRWAGGTHGPCAWFTGASTAVPAGPARPDDPDGPQNLGTNRVFGLRRLAVVLVETDTQEFKPGEAEVVRETWRKEMVDGVLDDGKLESVAHYLEEVSYGLVRVEADVFGPYSLEGPITEYFNAGGVAYMTYWQSCVTAADPDVDWRRYDHIVAVCRSTDPIRVDEVETFAAWPVATIGSRSFTTEEGYVALGAVSMPSDMPLRRVGSKIRGTTSHELGHNFGIHDQYIPRVPMPAAPPELRNVGRWCMMAGENHLLGHFAGVHRMRFGWIDRSWIRTLDLADGPWDELVTLSPIAAGAPAAGEYSIVELRVADGRNYYFEYRRADSTQIGDQFVGPPSVLGTDHTSPPDEPLSPRPTLLLLPNDDDGDGSVLQQGMDYHAPIDHPTFPADLRFDASLITIGFADVRVRYDVPEQPDPSIRPWPAGPDQRYQSPDIEIRNARNAADPRLKNVPWQGHLNTIVAQIRNRGSAPAPGVQVSFFEKTFTTGSTLENKIATVMQDVPAGATVEFSTEWLPPVDEHFCVAVRIEPYTTPGPLSVAEAWEGNNAAQSNYDRFISSTASPASRDVVSVLVTNPFAEATRVDLAVSQSHPGYRTYIEHRWVWLEPGEARPVRVMVEHAGGFPALGPQPVDVQLDDPNVVTVTAYPLRPGERGAAPEHDGIQVLVLTGRRTQTRIEPAGLQVTGVVTTVDEGQPVDSGRVLVSSMAPGDRTWGGYQVLDLVKGRYAAQLPQAWTRVNVTYLPGSGLTESTSSADRN